MRTIKCPSCGAPVGSEAPEQRFKCAYCGSLVEMEGRRAILVERGTGAARPAPSGSGRGCGLALLGVLAVVLLVASVAAVAVATRLGGGGPVTWDELRVQSLDQEPGELAGALGLHSVSDKALYVPLDDAIFDYASLTWDPEHPGHATGVHLGLDAESRPSPLAPAVLAGLDAFWGTRWQPVGAEYRAFRWKDATMQAAADLSSLHLAATPDADPEWERRLDLLWSVAGAVLAGEVPVVPEDDQRRWLALGPEPAGLAHLAPSTPVERAEKVSRQVFEDALVTESSGVEVVLPLHHAQVARVELDWPDEEGGVLDSARLLPPDTSTGWRDQEALASCLTEAFGPGRETVSGYLEGTRRYGWEPPGARTVDLHPTQLSVYLDRGPRAEATWTALWRALDGCGG